MFSRMFLGEYRYDPMQPYRIVRYWRWVILKLRTIGTSRP